MEQAAKKAHILQVVPAGEVGVGALGGGTALHHCWAGRTAGSVEAAGQGVGFHPKRVGQGPGSDVVGERVFELGLGLEQHFYQRGFGLIHAHHHIVRLNLHVFSFAGGVVEAFGFGAPGGKTVFDLVAAEVLGEGAELAGVVAGRQHVGFELALRLGFGGGEVALELAQQVVVALGGGLDGGAAGRVVVGNALG